MSVMLPWRRKPELPESNRPHNRDALKDRPRQANRSIWPGVLLATALLCAGVLIALVTAGRETQGKALWSQSGASLVSAAGGEYLLQIGNSLSVWGTQGCNYVLERPAQQGLLTPHGVIAADGSMIALETRWSREELLSVPSGGFLVAQSFDGCFYLASPTGGGFYGESWLVQAATTSGETRWQATVPAVPVAVRQLGTRGFVAATDVATGGEPCLYCIDTVSGKRLWSRSLGSGMWRELFVNGETVSAVLDNLVKRFSSDGKALWAFEPPGPITSAASVGGSMVLAWDPPWKSPVDRLVSSGVLLLASDGTVRWRKYVAGRRFTVADTGQELLGEGNAHCVALLWENNVTCHRVADGQQVLSLRIRGFPLDFGAGTVLVRDGDNLKLVVMQGR